MEDVDKEDTEWLPYFILGILWMVEPLPRVDLKQEEAEQI